MSCVYVEFSTKDSVEVVRVEASVGIERLVLGLKVGATRVVADVRMWSRK